MDDLTKLPNIGKILAKQLNDVGITTLEELKQVGAEKAWLKIQKIDKSACINRLFALEGAIYNINKALISDKRKQELKEFYKNNKLQFIE